MNRIEMIATAAPVLIVALLLTLLVLGALTLALPAIALYCGITALVLLYFGFMGMLIITFARSLV